MRNGVVFGRSMIGYNIRDGIMTIEPAGAETVRNIFKMFVEQNLSLTEIVCELEQMNVPTYTGKTHWQPATIRKILANEKYCGDLIQRKTYTPDYLTHRKQVNNNPDTQIIIRNHHESIVERTVWERAQIKLNKRKLY